VGVDTCSLCIASANASEDSIRPSLIAESLTQIEQDNRYGDLGDRRKNTPSRRDSARSQRTLNLAGAFEVRGRVPECAIVVDDVYTTGSTL